MIKRSSELDLELIVRQHYDAVFRFCARRVGPDRAADVSQETFLTAQKVLHKYRGDSTVSTWLLGIANNECRRYSRSKSHDALAIEILPDIVGTEGETNQIIDRHALSQAMQKLSDEHREIVILHELDGLTYEEAAEVLQIPVGTVKSRLHHAFQQLRRSLYGSEEIAR